ncbi:MAG: hypothetical protein ABEH58_06095 [Haloplanus sp.]
MTGSRRAVGVGAGVDALGPWVDRYVTTDALPPLPDDPSAFVYAPDLDPDGDGTASGEETSRGTNPFVADASATPTETETETEAKILSTAPTTADGGQSTVARPTTGVGEGFGAPGAVAGIAATALAATLLVRRR